MPAPITINEYGTPAASVITAVYTVPEKRRARCNLILTNHSGSASVVDVWLDLQGSGVANANRVVSTISMAAYTNISLSDRFGDHTYLTENAVIWVRSDTGDVNCMVMGYEADLAANVD